MTRMKNSVTHVILRLVPAMRDSLSFSLTALILSFSLSGAMFIAPAMTRTSAGLELFGPVQQGPIGPSAFDMPEITGQLVTQEEIYGDGSARTMPVLVKIQPTKPLYRTGHKVNQSRHPSLPPVEMPLPVPRPAILSVQDRL